MMNWEDFGLTQAQVKAAFSGTEADRAAIFDQIASSERFDEYLAHLQQTKPQSYQVVAPYLRRHRDRRGGIARTH